MHIILYLINYLRNHVNKNIDNILGTTVFLKSEVLDAIASFDSNNLSTSNRSNEYDDVSHATFFRRIYKTIFHRIGYVMLSQKYYIYYKIIQVS